MKRIELIGRVFAGKGEGKKFIELPWVGVQINKKLGFKPYPGTLNLRLSRDSSKLTELINKNKILKIYPPAGYCEGLLFKATIGELDIGVIVPQVDNYPSDVLEVVSPLHLREELKLHNGNLVTVTFCS